MTASKTSDTKHSEGSDREMNRDTKWVKFAPASVGTVKLEPFTHVDLEGVVSDLEVRIQLHPSDPGKVNVGFTVSGSKNGNGVHTGAIANLSPEQAEELAESLTECVAAAVSEPDVEG